MAIKFLDSKRISTSPSSATSVQGYSQLNAGTNGWNIASGAGDGERLSLQIVSGSSIIADPIKEIKMKLYKNSSPTDTLYVRVRNSSDTILAEASKGASTLTGSLTEYTFTLNTGVILAQGDRINIEYTGPSGSGNIGCGVNNATEPSTVNCQKYDGTSYSDIDRTPDWQFDSSPSTTISILQSHPVNVQDNSILVEKDTAKRYWFDAGSTDSQLLGDDSRTLNHTTQRIKLSMRFNAGHVLEDQPITKVTWNLSRSSTSPTGNVTAHIRTSSGVEREQSTTLLDATTLTTSYVDKEFVFTGNTVLDDTDMITCEFSSTSNANNINMRAVLGSTLAPPANTEMWNYSTGSGWSRVAQNSGYYDTLKFKVDYASGGTWIIDPTYEDDFSTDNWTPNDSTYIGVSGGVMNWNAKRDGSNDACVHDLTSTKINWTLRFKLHVTNVSGSTQAGNGFYVGLSDSIQTAGQSTSQDFIGVSIYNDNTDTYRTIDADGSAIPAIYQGDSYQATTYNTGSIWYYEIIKTGSSYTVEAFSGSDYSTGSEGKITGSSSATGLRYLKVLNDMASIPTSTNPFQGTIDDLKFYDGVTSV